MPAIIPVATLNSDLLNEPVHLFVDAKSFESIIGFLDEYFPGHPSALRVKDVLKGTNTPHAGNLVKNSVRI